MTNTQNRRTVIVGFFIFFGILFLLSAILMVGNLRETFVSKMKVVSLFDDVGGLRKGNNIWFSGVKIGTVSKLAFFGESQVEVSMKIDKAAQQYIRRDAMVKLSSDGLIGNKILVIYGGTAKSAMVEEGDTLDVDKSFTSEDMLGMLQESNKNLLAITTDIKTISNKITSGKGSIGKLLTDDSVFENIKASSMSLHSAISRADKLAGSLVIFSEGLNRKGTLANELTSDTVVFNSIKASVLYVQQMADTATVIISGLKKAVGNRNTSVGVMLHDEAAGTQLRSIIKNIETSTKKLDEDLEAAQHSIFLKGFFKDNAKKEKAIK